MPGEQHIADVDLFDKLDTESERVAAFFESDPDWDAPTRCEGWNVRDLLGHVAGVETYHLACLDDAIVDLFEKAAAEGGVTGLDSFNDWAISSRADRSSSDVFDEWRTKNREVRERMHALGRDGTMSSSVGPYNVGMMAAHIASEYATHADDMAIPIPEAERAERTAWRLRVSLFAVEEAGKGVTIERVGDAFGVTSGDAKAVLRPEDLVEAITARLPADFAIDPALRDALRALA